MVGLLIISNSFERKRFLELLLLYPSFQSSFVLSLCIWAEGLIGIYPSALLLGCMLRWAKCFVDSWMCPILIGFAF